MKAVILSGGLGTRMGELCRDIPKSMLPVSGRPFLEWQIMKLKSLRIDEVVLCTGVLHDSIEEYFGNGSKFGVDIRYSRELNPLGTAGAVKNASDLITSNFLLLNGDTLFNIDYWELARRHIKNEGIMTIALHETNDVSEFGTVELAINGRILSFNEKGLAGRGMMNSGVYVLSPEIFNYIPERIPTSLEEDTIPGLIDRGLPIFGTVLRGDYLDIGTPERYERVRDVDLSAIIR